MSQRSDDEIVAVADIRRWTSDLRKHTDEIRKIHAVASPAELGRLKTITDELKELEAASKTARFLIRGIEARS
jgi:hypothetical protein